MTGNTITIPARVLSGIRRHAVAAAPAECCGALAGALMRTGVEVRTLIPVPNDAVEPTRYSIEAPTVLRLERHARCAGLDLIGFYHSHPAGPPVPSGIDLELACPGYVYIIVEPARGSVRAWRLKDDRSGFDELSIGTLEGVA